MKKRIISLMLALIMVLGIIPMASASEETAAQEPIVMDFMGFAAEAAEQDFWADLYDNNVAGAKTLGAPYEDTEPSEAYLNALAAMEEWMDGRYNWNLPNITGNYSNKWGGRYIYLDPASEYFGLRTYTHFPNNGSAESRTILSVNAPAAGDYLMTVTGYWEVARGSAVPSYTGADNGGAMVDTYINGEKVGTFHQSGIADDNGEYFATDSLGVVTLQEGYNEIWLWTIADRGGYPYAGRCATNLSNITFTPVSSGDLVLDFNGIKDIAKEDFWANLRPVSESETAKAIGCVYSVSPEASYTEALGQLDAWLDAADLGWNIPDLLDGLGAGGHFNHPYGGRQMFVDAESDYYGLRLHSYYPGNGSGESMFTIKFDVPAELAGYRKMTVETYDEAVTSAVPATNGYKGGGMASFYVNDEELIYYHEFGAEEDGVRTVTADWAVELVPGENTLLIVLEADRNGTVQGAGASSCAINLRNITFSEVACEHEGTEITYTYENLRDGTHIASAYCECDAKIGEETVACADGDDEDTLCDACGFNTKKRGPSTYEFAEDSIYIDFMDFAYNVMQQPWFNDFDLAGNAEGIRSIGNLPGIEPTDEAKAACASLETWLGENTNWNIANLTSGSSGHYAHAAGNRQIYIDTINEYYGLRFYTHIPNNEGAATLNLLVNVPEGQAGTYNMNVEGFYEAYKSAVPMADAWDNGGAQVKVKINGEEIGGFHQVADEDQIVIDELGEVTLEEGINSIDLFVIGDRSGYPYAGRCALNLRNIEFQLVELAPEVPAIETFAVAGVNMTLGNELELNIMLPKSTVDAYGKDLTATVTHHAATEDAVYTWAVSELPEYANGRYYKASIRVAAAQMTDLVDIVVTDTEGNVYNEEYETSVRTYVTNNIDKQKDVVKTLLVDMVNYGAAAQDQFSYRQDDYANANLTEEHKALATPAVECTDIRDMGTNYVGSNLSLQDKILLNFFFKKADDAAMADMYATVKFTGVLGNEVEETVSVAKMSGYTGVAVDQIVLADSVCPVTVTVYNADGTVYAYATDSVESYNARQNPDGTNALYTNIMKFAASALAYKNS